MVVPINCHSTMERVKMGKKTTTLCWNCNHAEVCKFLENIKKAFEGFPYWEDPEYYDSEYAMSLGFDDVEPTIASFCKKFSLRKEGSIREL